MKKLLLLMMLAPACAWGQSNPGFSNGTVLTGPSLSNAFTGKVDVNNGNLNNPSINSPTINNPTFTGFSSLSLVPPAGSQAVALNVTQAPTGTSVPELDLSVINVTSDNVNAGTQAVIGLKINQNFGGPNMQGGRAGLWAVTTLTAASSASNTNTQYSAVAGASVAASADGGTGGAPRGSFFGANFYVQANSGALNLYNTTAAEFNSYDFSGSSVKYKTIVQLSGGQNDTVLGSAVDAMQWFYNQSGAVAWNYGLLFDGQYTIWPIAATGTIVGSTGAGTAANGVDFSATTITGCAFKSANICLGGPNTVADIVMPVQINTPNTAAASRYFGADFNGTYGVLFGYDNGVVNTGGEIREVDTSPLSFVVNNNVTAMQIFSNGLAQFFATVNLNAGSALALTTTTGYAQLPFNNGIPTGAPSGNTNCAIDTANGYLNCYYGGSWHKIAFAGGAG